MKSFFQFFQKKKPMKKFKIKMDTKWPENGHVKDTTDYSKPMWDAPSQQTWNNQ